MQWAPGPTAAVGVLLGNGDGSFGSPSNYPATYPIPSAPDLQFVAVGDFDGDGKPDLMTANWADHSCTFLKGNGKGSFTATTTNGVGAHPDMVAVADFNGDGKLDFITANSSRTNNLSLRLGNGDGTFAPARYLSTDGSPSFLAVADFNGDGRPDIATANGSVNSVSVLLNQSPPALQVSLVGGQVRLAWPDWVGFQLESNTNLLGRGVWTSVTNASFVLGTQRILTNAPPEKTRFFRLRKL